MRMCDRGLSDTVRPGEVLQFGAKRMRLCTRTSQMKYTLQGSAYDCVYTLTYA